MVVFNHEDKRMYLLINEITNEEVKMKNKSYAIKFANAYCFYKNKNATYEVDKIKKVVRVYLLNKE